MDDVHFILRHAMTGAVFVFFTLAGLTFLDVDISARLPTVPGEWPAAAAALAIIAFPMIGITVQGAHYCAYTLYSGLDWFGDPARKLIADKIRNTIIHCQEGDREKAVDWTYLRSAPDDAFFVWLYHHRATPHMIEWARRRRSYYYLGWNWVLAAAAGVIAAVLYSQLKDWDGSSVRLMLCGFALVWAGGAIWAAERMRRDADTMEAIWAAAQIDPKFRSCLAELLPMASAEAGRTADDR